MAVDRCPDRPAAQAELPDIPPVPSGWDAVDKRDRASRINDLDITIVNVRSFVNKELG
jgi:hypothetical protein